MGLINKEEFLEKMKRTSRYFAVKFDIEEMPEVDPVHAAGGCYCWECERWSKDKKGFGYERVCNRWSEEGLIDHYTMPADWCKWGRRREGADG